MWRVYLITALIGLFAVSVGFGYIRAMIAENKELKTALTAANASITALDQAAEKRAAINQTERNRINEIDHAPQSDDGPIAPVLRRTIDGL